MLFDEDYGSDHVGLNSPTLTPIRPNLNPIFDGVEIYSSEVCAINEVGFSRQWRGVNHYSDHEWDDYSDHEWEPSQNDAILIYLLSGGTAVDVARTAATEPLAIDDEDDLLLKEVMSQRPKNGLRKCRQRGGTLYDVKMLDTAKDQCDGRPKVRITQLEPSFNPNGLLEVDIPERLSPIYTEARTAKRQQISPSQLIAQSSIDQASPNGGHGHIVLHKETKGPESNCTDNENDNSRQWEQHFINTSEDDVPITDSGCSSLQRNLHQTPNISSSFEEPQFPAMAKQSTLMSNADRADAKTSYSAASTVDPVIAQHCIAEVCADICSNIRQCFDGKLWSTLSRALPLLIEAFAIKIGHCSSNQVNREIMYFVHKRHK